MAPAHVCAGHQGTLIRSQARLAPPQSGHAPRRIAVALHPELNAVVQAVGRVLLGKEHTVRLALSCLLALALTP